MSLAAQAWQQWKERNLLHGLLSWVGVCGVCGYDAVELKPDAAIHGAQQ